MATQESAQEAQNNSEEDSLESSLERLNELHLQVRNLRSALPRLLQPLSVQHSSPEELFSSLKHAVLETKGDLDEFRDAFTNEESRKIFDQANESRKANPKGIRPWRALDNPDWTAVKKR
ncbi:hypothetical protein VTK73DRAFT_7478 [Phialemonium thermophilum]|uniref:Uncharacterized protein n=1 Tax=Phialemonium thermophilum TaxID=223376 RepID=A0ABR3XSW4_9PEZI